MFILPCEAVNKLFLYEAVPTWFASSKPKQRETNSFGLFNHFHRPAAAPKVSDAEFPEHREYIQFQTAKKGEKKRGMVAKFRATKK